MRGTVFNFLLVITWPSLQALFIVEAEKESYDAVLHGSIRLGCRFTPVPSVSELSVIWQRITPLPKVGVFRLEKGQENFNFTDKHFQRRAQLVKKELESRRAVLELSNVQISDSGDYWCIISHYDDADYKQTRLTVRAPYTPVKKSIRSLGNDMVELSCESQGFPMASVVWNASNVPASQLVDRTNMSSEKTSDGTFKVTSRLNIRHNAVSNYMCSFELEDKVQQTATFRIPDEIPRNSRWSHGFVAAGVIIVMCVGFALATLLLRRRKKGQSSNVSSPTTCLLPDPNLTVTSTDLLLPKASKESRIDTFTFSSDVCREKTEKLREALQQKYAELDIAHQKQSGLVFAPGLLQNGESHCLEIQSVLPGSGETVLLEGKEGCGKTYLTQKLASSWADSLNSEPFNIHFLQLVILIDFKEVKGDVFNVVKSTIPSEAGLETVDLREILLGNTESLLILDGYKEGDREVDESLVKFLAERTGCRVLITACPGEYGVLQQTVRKVLRLQVQPAES